MWNKYFEIYLKSISTKIQLIQNKIISFLNWRELCQNKKVEKEN